MSDLRRDYIRTNVVNLMDENKAVIQDVFTEMRGIALDNYKEDKYTVDQVIFTHYVDLRYSGQEHYVKVHLSNFTNDTPLDDIIEKFHEAHEKQYTFRLEARVELVNFHLVAEVAVNKPDFPKMEKLGKKLEDAIVGKDEIDFDDLGVQTGTYYHRDGLEPEMTLQGPAVIVESATTTVLPPNHSLRIDELGNLIIQKKN